MEDEEDLWDPPVASLVAPNISGLHFAPDLLIAEPYAKELAQKTLPFFSAGSNQVMLFGRPSSAVGDTSGGLPDFISNLIDHLSRVLLNRIPGQTHVLLFPEPDEFVYPARQVILNLYRPGEGISPHVDLISRFGDGIIGVSLLSGTVMSFTPASPAIADLQTIHQLWLPPRSIIVLENDARYKWKHGIPARKQDFIEEEDSENVWYDRHTRISITIRWLLPGAEIVGGDGPSLTPSMASDADGPRDGLGSDNITSHPTEVPSLQ